MGSETTKAQRRRVRDADTWARILRGAGIDVGSGTDPLPGARPWDVQDGDGARLATVPDDSLDYVHSSHALEHMSDPATALKNWIRVVRPGGHVVVVVPDEDMYEQGRWPSVFNSDHKWTFTVCKPRQGARRSWSTASINVLELCASLCGLAELVRLERLMWDYDWQAAARGLVDQTLGDAACALEFVLRKR